MVPNSVIRGDEWSTSSSRSCSSTSSSGICSTASSDESNPKVKEEKRALTFKERFELEELLTKIDDLETEITDIEVKMCEPEFYKSDSQKIADTQKRLSKARVELESAMERWEYLSEFE